MNQKTYIAKTDKQFQEELNVYISHLVFGTELSPKQQEMYNRYLCVRSMKAQSYPQTYIVKVIKEGIENEFAPTTQSNAYKIYQDAILIFGDPELQNKAFEKWAKIEYCETMAMQVMRDAQKTDAKIELADAYKIAWKYTKLAVDLRGLLEEDVEGIDPNDFTSPSDWEYEITADPQALLKAAGEAEEDEDTPFDDFTEVE